MVVVIIMIVRVECATLAEFDQLQVMGFGQSPFAFASDARPSIGFSRNVFLKVMANPENQVSVLKLCSL